MQIAESHSTPASAKDLAILCHLDSTIFGSQCWSQAQWHEELNSAWVMVLLFWCGSDACGFISGDAAGDTLEIRKLGVLAEKRRQGIAGQLLRDLLARHPSCRRCLVDVAAGNLPAQAFYQKHGFCQIARRKNYYATGDDALVLEKILCTVWQKAKSPYAKKFPVS